MMIGQWKILITEKAENNMVSSIITLVCDLENQSYCFSSSHVWWWELDHSKAECWRIDAFELWCWRRLLRIPWTARISSQPILKEISPGCSLERLMLKLKLQYFGHLMQRADSLEKTLMLGQIEGRRRRRWQRMMVGWHHWLDGHESEQAPEVGDGQGSLASCSLWGHKESDMTEQLNWAVTLKMQGGETKVDLSGLLELRGQN